MPAQTQLLAWQASLGDVQRVLQDVQDHGLVGRTTAAAARHALQEAQAQAT